jgi:hypothetical protein
VRPQLRQSKELSERNDGLNAPVIRRQATAVAYADKLDSQERTLAAFGRLVRINFKLEHQYSGIAACR